MEEAYHHAYEDRAGAALVIDGPLSEAKRVEGLQQEKNEGQNKEGSHSHMATRTLPTDCIHIGLFF